LDGNEVTCNGAKVSLLPLPHSPLSATRHFLTSVMCMALFQNKFITSRPPLPLNPKQELLNLNQKPLFLFSQKLLLSRKSFCLCCHGGGRAIIFLHQDPLALILVDPSRQSSPLRFSTVPSNTKRCHSKLLINTHQFFPETIVYSHGFVLLVILSQVQALAPMEAKDPKNKPIATVCSASPMISRP
jgi:hypothetical protein